MGRFRDGSKSTGATHRKRRVYFRGKKFALARRGGKPSHTRTHDTVLSHSHMHTHTHTNSNSWRVKGVVNGKGNCELFLFFFPPFRRIMEGKRQKNPEKKKTIRTDRAHRYYLFGDATLQNWTRARQSAVARSTRSAVRLERTRTQVGRRAARENVFRNEPHTHRRSRSNGVVRFRYEEWWMERACPRRSHVRSVARRTRSGQKRRTARQRRSTGSARVF